MTREELTFPCYLEKTPINQKHQDQWEQRRLPEVLINLERQVNIHWQCNLGEKEAGHPVGQAIGEAEVQVPDLLDRDLAATANHDIKPQSLISNF
jgi:hypothetical protein